MKRRRLVFLVMGGVMLLACGSEAPIAPLSSERIRESAVQVAAIGCRTVEIRGAGLMVANGRIATVAHVVAGATRVEVRGAHGNAEATVVYFDPILDVALLKVDPHFAPPIAIGTAARGD
ncbi:MAG: hypothetical protein QOC57_1885, partial [Ilumatobacteraceae bacterium]